MTWYARTGPRRKESGKFKSHSHLGTAQSAGGQHRGWHFDFVAHQTGSGVRRTRYAVSISDPNKNRVEYLRDFSNIGQATDAAKEWIDRTLGLLIPALPIDAVPTRERPSSSTVNVSGGGSLAAQGSIGLPKPGPGVVGTIPTPPTELIAQEK